MRISGWSADVCSSDLIDGAQPPVALQAAAGRHFFGHGVFLPDGRRMLATENHYEAGHGVLGVYDASDGGDYRRIGEFPTGGVGPHEVVLLPDGRSEEHTYEIQSRMRIWFSVLC